VRLSKLARQCDGGIQNIGLRIAFKAFAIYVPLCWCPVNNIPEIEEKNHGYSSQGTLYEPETG
jgi:hypothetical protein